MIVSPSKRPATIEELLPSALAARLDRLDVRSRKIFAGRLQGERRSKRRGQSVEFADYRTYVPGDDLRRIDWNVFARLDRFFIRVFQEEEDLAVNLVLDASASMDAGGAGGGGVGGEPVSKLLLAQRLAMALGYMSLVHNNRVSVSVFDGRELRRMEPMRGRPNVPRLARFLIDAAADEPAQGAERARPRLAGDFTSALKAIATTRIGRGVMIVMSDFLIPPRGGYREGLRFLAGGGGSGGGGGGFDTYCVQILSPGELDPSSEPGGALIGDLKLMDAETGRAAEVTITADLVTQYKASVQAYIAELRDYCAARGMNHVLVRSDADVASLLIDDLRLRGVVG